MVNWTTVGVGRLTVDVGAGTVLVGWITAGVFVGGRGLGIAVKVLNTEVSSWLVLGVGGRIRLQAGSKRRMIINPSIFFIMAILPVQKGNVKR